jgi:thiosulfate/3-mercaptopyruvate sulfurtransferase
MKQYSQMGLIEPEELKAIMKDGQSVRLLDASFALPNMDDDPYDNFCKERIDNAIFFDIDKFADESSDLPHMIPSPEQLALKLSDAGLSNDDFIVIYDQTGICMAACRAWWTFKVIGHDNVVLLNGGLPAWKNNGYEMNTNPPMPHKKSSYTIKSMEGDMIASLSDIYDTIDGKTNAQIIDVRPKERYSGAIAEPRQGLKKGHMPGSKNIPWSEFIDSETKKFKSKQQLEELFLSYNIDFQTPIISSCGSGATACVLDFALYHMGKNHSKVYDGSWAEYGQETLETPIQISA